MKRTLRHLHTADNHVAMSVPRLDQPSHACTRTEPQNTKQNKHGELELIFYVRFLLSLCLYNEQ